MKYEALKILRLRNYVRTSPVEEALVAIETLASCPSPRAIRALASLMKLPDVRGEAAMVALIDIGTDVEEEMHRSIESSDELKSWRAQQVLSALHGIDDAA
jgi:hypothetical protein